MRDRSSKLLQMEAIIGDEAFSPDDEDEDKEDKEEEDDAALASRKASTCCSNSSMERASARRLMCTAGRLSDALSLCTGESQGDTERRTWVKIIEAGSQGRRDAVGQLMSPKGFRWADIYTYSGN
jgi:hypothetical protein